MVVDIVRRGRTKALVDQHCLSVDGVHERSHMTRVIDSGQRRALSNPRLQVWASMLGRDAGQATR